MPVRTMLAAPWYRWPHPNRRVEASTAPAGPTQAVEVGQQVAPGDDLLAHPRRDRESEEQLELARRMGKHALDRGHLLPRGRQPGLVSPIAATWAIRRAHASSTAPHAAPVQEQERGERLGRHRRPAAAIAEVTRFAGDVVEHRTESGVLRGRGGDELDFEVFVALVVPREARGRKVGGGAQHELAL